MSIMLELIPVWTERWGLVLPQAKLALSYTCWNGRSLSEWRQEPV